MGWEMSKAERMRLAYLHFDHHLWQATETQTTETQTTETQTTETQTTAGPLARSSKSEKGNRWKPWHAI
jgi:hypothetical protein